MRTASITLLLGALIVYGGLKVLNFYTKNDLRNGLAEEFALSEEGTDFVLQCVLKDHGSAFTDGAAKRNFCGCLGTGIASELSKRELEVAAFVFEQNRTKGINVPNSGTARTEIAARVATALESNTSYCRSNYS